MKRILAGILFFVGISGLYWILGKANDHEAQGNIVYGTVLDATGLPIGTPVHLAGIPIGKVESLALAGSNAELGIRLRKNVKIFEDAVLLKRTPSILSEPVLEIFAGASSHSELPDGGHIKRTKESPHLDDTIRSLEHAIPEFGEGAISFKGVVDEAHDKLDSELLPRFEEWKEEIDNFTVDTKEKLKTVDSKIEELEGAVELDVDKEIKQRLDNAEKTTQRWPSKISKWTPTVKEYGEKARVTISDIAKDARQAWKEFANDVDHVDKGQGQLGALVNSRDLSETLESGVQGVVNAVKTLTGWTMGLTMRAEMQAGSGLPQFYFTVQAQRRPENFYLMEIVKNTRGRVFQDLRYDPNIGRYRQFATIEERVRFSLQWGKRIRGFVFRGGIKESTLGTGMDIWLWNDRIRLSSDVYDFGFGNRPRVRLSGNMKVYGALYATLGVADLLQRPERLPIEVLGDTVPVQFEEYRYGRDVFIGGELRVTDRDIAGMLFLGKKAIAGLGK